MKRREFLQGVLAVAAAVLLPKAVQQLPAHIPGALIFNGEEAGRRLMEELRAGIQKPILIPAPSQVGEIFWSDDGGVTWKPMSSDDAQWFSFNEPGDTWPTYDPDIGLYFGQIPESTTTIRVAF